MPISKEERRRRLILCRALVDILRPTEIDVGTTGNERLVAYCVGISTFGPHLMGLNKIAEATGLPRSTIRGVLHKLGLKGWVDKKPDGSYVFTRSIMASAGVGMKLMHKYRILQTAAESLGDLDNDT